MVPIGGQSDDELSPFLEEAIEAAESELRQLISPDQVSLVSAISEDLVGSRIGIVSSGGDLAYLGRKVGNPHTDPEEVRAAVDSLPDDPASWPTAVRFAVKLILLERGVDRAEAALVRYSKIRSASIRRTMPERAREYVDDVVDAYLFGFDTAAIALACSCFEQLARHTLVAVGEATERQLDRDRLTADALRIRLERAGLLAKSTAAATKLVLQRNHVLHKRMFDPKVQVEEISLGCLKALMEVCQELAPSWPEVD